MSRTDSPDAIDWAGALARSVAEAQALQPGTVHGPKALCLCGSTDTRDGIRFQPLDLTAIGDDLAVQVNEGQKFCAACKHGIAHGAMRVTRHYTATSTVLDHFHPNCVRF